MTVVMTRVDERLIHGQIMVGWRGALRFDQIGVADAALAGDSWERDLVVSAGGGDVEVEIATPREAAAWYGEETSARRLVLLRSLASLVEIVGEGAEVGPVNLGGLYFREGARRFCDYLFFTRDDIELLKILATNGLRLEAQDLPGNPAQVLNPALAEGRLEYDHLPVGGS